MSPLILIGLGIIGLYVLYRWRKGPPAFDWRNYDVNKDGIISGEEISALFADHNAGIITEEQFLEVMAHVGEPPPEEPPEEPPPEEPPPEEPPLPASVEERHQAALTLTPTEYARWLQRHTILWMGSLTPEEVAVALKAVYAELARVSKGGTIYLHRMPFSAMMGPLGSQIAEALSWLKMTAPELHAEVIAYREQVFAMYKP